MNKAYRLIWSKAKERWIVAAEIIKGNGGPPPVTVAAAVLSVSLMFGVPFADALPTGGQVVNGQAAISSSSATQMNINQGTNQAIINWNSFGIGKGEAVNIAQPSASSTLLNRVLGNNPSQIFGSLTANGQVFLVNPGGVLFAPGASVNVGGLVASSLNIKDSDFLVGKYSFFKDGTAGAVVNQGNISGGFVALLGNSVENAGTIVTTKGTTGLAAGDEITLGFDPNGLMAIKVDKAVYNAQVTNSGVIEADGGTVVMTASAADTLLTTVVNNSGTIRARSMVERNGEIVIEGGTSGVVEISGTLDASSDTGKGGQIVATGQHVTIVDGAKIAATGATGGGTINIGGGWQGSGDIAQATTVTMQQSTIIDASATQQGDGGKVVLWATGTTDFAGSILAKGAGLGGSGGSAEVSGKALLNYTGQTNLLGSQGGGTGTLLLDPYNLYITTDTGGSVTSGSSNSILGVSTLTSALTTADVVVSTGSGGSQSGNIGVMTDITTLSTHNLTLTATKNVVLDGNISLVGKLTVNAGGNFVMGTNLATAAGVTISANGGFVKTGTGTSYLTGNISTSNTAITIAGPVQVANFSGISPLSLSSGGGSITLSGAVSAYTGTALNYALLMASNLYDGITVSTVSGSSTDMYLMYYAGSNVLLNQWGLPTLNYVVVGGGGGGGYSQLGTASGGGGGGGGVATGTYTLSGSTYASISVGAGGSAQSSGNDSTFGTIKVGAGGRGGDYSTVGAVNRLPGVGGVGYAAGGGGGGAGFTGGGGAAGGTGTQRNGGTGGSYSSNGMGGAGGGAGGTASYTTSGSGVQSCITGTCVNYGVGGAPNGTPTANTGGGGGAIGYGSGSGASGIAIVSYTVGNATTSAASALKLNAGSGSVTLGSTVSGVSSLEVNAGASSSIAGVVSGVGSLIKSGTGTLTLSGVNSYTGATTISAGTLALDATGTIAASSGVANAGTFTIAANKTIASLTGAGATTLGGILTIGDSNNYSGTYSGIASGTGGIAKAGTGTMTLSGANSYTGATTISAGTLALDATGTIAASSGMANAGTFTIAAAKTIDSLTGAGATTLGGILTIGDASNTTCTYSGVASGTGGIAKAGTGILTLTGRNTFTGGTTVNAGGVTAGNSTNMATDMAFGGGPLVINSGGTVTCAYDNALFGTGLIPAQSITINAGGILTTGADSVTVHMPALTMNGGTLTGPASATGNASTFGTFNLDGGVTASGTTTSTISAYSILMPSGSSTTFNINTGATLGASSILLGTGGLIKSGSGTMTLSGVNSYTGATTINSGTLALDATGRIDASSGVVNAGTFTIAAAKTIDSLTGVGATTLGGILTIGDSSNTTGTYSGIASGTGGITKAGTGTLTLSGANTYSGVTTVSAGTLAVTVNEALGSTAAGTTEASGAGLDFQNIAYLSAETVTLNGGTLKTSTGTSSFAGGVTLGADSWINVGGTQLTLSGVISGSAKGISKIGTGTLTISGVNSYTGATTITAGFLASGATGVIADASAVTVVSGATWNLNNFDETVGSLADYGSITLGSATLTTGGNNSSTGAQITSTRSLQKDSPDERFFQLSLKYAF